MSKSIQIVRNSIAENEASQKSTADDATQEVAETKAAAIRQEVTSPKIDFVALRGELERLRAALHEEPSTVERDLSLGDVAAAERAAARNDEHETWSRLKSAGTWALEVAQKIGLEVAAAAIKHSIGV